ncbi:MAG: PD40 domain-containing protein [Leptolyngbya sp. SIO1E4]|nr:PD40 domain-containing protein [Leptolyngbya sp. SIO1E4]
MQVDRNIRIEGNATGNAIISGDGNTVYVIQQTKAQRQEFQIAAAVTEIGPNPYKGLTAFQESDADRYFGREEQVDDLIERFQTLHSQNFQFRFLSILGPSGCGKSSLVRAGFIPELARRPLPSKERMRVAVLVPGTHPVEALAGVLAKVATQDPMPATKTREFTAELKLQTTDRLYDGMRRITDLMPQIKDSPLVVLVDQFEEVYSLCKDLNERQAFIENLLCAASAPTGNLSVVITLRSDFLGEVQRHQTLNQITAKQSVIVPAMTQYELRDAIAKPAQQAGYPLDENTIDRLIKDTEGREGALPLLQFALQRIWEGLRQGQEPMVVYQEMKGVGGGLANQAQTLYEALSAEEQKMARRVFVGLVQLGEGNRVTRRRIAVETLLINQDELETLKRVIQQFSSQKARLISLSGTQEGQEVAEVTHEALFEHWQQFHNWLDSSRDDIRFQRRLESAVHYWNQQGRPEGLLWRPPDLDLLRDFQQRAAQDMTALETSFWQVSHQAEQRRKRNKSLVTAGLATGLVLTTVSSGIAFWNVEAANRSRIEAQRNNVQTLAQTAAALNASGKSFEANIAGLKAAKQFQRNQIPDAKISNEIRGELVTAQLVRNREITRLEGHSDSVWVVRFSPDGTTLATGSSDGTAKLWQADGTLITTLEGHSNALGDVHFSPDGTALATASSDGTAKLWQADGTLIATLEGHSDWVWVVRFSPDSTILATGSRDGTAKLWQADGTLITTLDGHSGWVGDVRFSPDSTTLVTTSFDGTAKLWQADGTLITTLEGHSDVVGDVRFSPDGKILATASSDGTAKLWQTDGTLITTLEGHSDAVWVVRFSPDGKVLATTSSDGTVKLWQADGTLIATLEGHSDVVWVVHFSPDGNTLATASEDGTTKLWQVDGTLITTLEGHIDAVLDVHFSPDGKTLATASRDGTAKLWQAQSMLITILEDHSNWVWDVHFSPDGSTLATASRDGTAKLWQADGTLITTLEGHSDAVGNVRFSPDGKILATTSENGTAKLWQADGTLITTLEGHSGPVRDVHFSPDGTTLATASSDGTAKLWQVDGTSITTLEGHSGPVGDVRFSPDGTTLATTSDDGTAKLWQVDGTSITTLEGHIDTVWDVRFSPDGTTLATASNDGTAKLWQADGTLITTLQGHSDRVLDVHFSPDGTTLATASSDGTAKLWQTDGTLITTFADHSDWVGNVRFSPDGKILATASSDGTAKLWQTDGTLITTLEGHSDAVWDVRFSPDGNTLATASGDGTTKLWPWSLDVLMAHTCEQVRGYLQSSPNVPSEDKNLCD